MELEQSQLVQWANQSGDRIVWMVTDKKDIGIVVHSDGLAKVGTTNDLSKIQNLDNFIGTVNIESDPK